MTIIELRVAAGFLSLCTAGFLIPTATAQTNPSSQGSTASGGSSIVSPQSSGSSGETDVQKRIDNATSVLDEVMGVPDKGIPDKIMADAKCIIVIPSMIHIAVGFGGRHGKGVATCDTARGWSAPAPVTITGGSWGLQLGGEAIDLVMMVMHKRGVDELLSSKFKVGAGASAAAGPLGRQISADTNWKMQSEILTYSRARGIFAGIDLNGAVIEQDRDETAVLYGKMVPFQDILNGDVRLPQGSSRFEAAVEKYSSQAKQREQ